MRPWRQPQDENAGPLVAEGVDRLSPIFPLAIGAAFALSDRLAVAPQARAALTAGDLPIEGRQRCRLFQIGHRAILG